LPLGSIAVYGPDRFGGTTTVPLPGYSIFFRQLHIPGEEGGANDPVSAVLRQFLAE
jgi:hypothetical protein